MGKALGCECAFLGSISGGPSELREPRLSQLSHGGPVLGEETLRRRGLEGRLGFSAIAELFGAGSQQVLNGAAPHTRTVGQLHEKGHRCRAIDKDAERTQPLTCLLRRILTSKPV